MGVLIRVADFLGPSLRPSVALPLATVMLALIYFISAAIYNVYFNPLRKYPGPRLWAISAIPYSRMTLTGNGHREMLKLHQKYGPVVRVAPDTLCYSHPHAIKDISGHRKGDKAENPKEPLRHAAQRDNIIGANREDHARYRKSMSNGFSQQAMIGQQPIIQKYVDKLFAKLDENSEGGQSVDLVTWFNFTTFDIIGDLAFGKPFGCLDDSAYHPWVQVIFQSMKSLSFMATLQRFGIFFYVLVLLFVPKKLLWKLLEHRKLSAAKVQNRLNMGSDRPDFMTSMITKRGYESPMTVDELASNASILIIGGSETTATALSAATYFLSMNPRPLAKLVAEIRSTFSSEDDINLLSVGGLEYMLAVLDEAMRLCPPVPGTQPRSISEQGDTIIGQYVPPRTVVEIWQWAVFHDPAHWRQAEEFIPERWLGDARFENDSREAFQPFSTGPRNCIGKNLAYAEMRLILAKLIWRYDIQLAHDSIGWDEKLKVHILYEKGPVNVYLTPRS